MNINHTSMPDDRSSVVRALAVWYLKSVTLGSNPNAVTVSPPFTSACADVIHYFRSLLWLKKSLVSFFTANCDPPTVPTNGSIYGAYQNTTEGTVIVFGCKSGFVPAGNTTAVCASDGRWIPDPADLVCTCKSAHSHLQYKKLWVGACKQGYNVCAFLCHLGMHKQKPMSVVFLEQL